MTTATERAQRVLDVVFGHHGLEATYTPPGGGTAVACTVIVDREDRELAGLSGRPIRRGDTIEVRASEVVAPAKGGSFAIEGSTFIVGGDPVTDDPFRLVWTCTAA